MTRRGTVVQRGPETWRLAIELEHDPVTGARHRLFETFHGGKRDAERRLTELLAQADQRLLVADPRMNLSQYCEQWLRDYAASKAPKTFHRYREILRAYVTPHLGGVRLDKLAPSHFVRLQTTLLDTDRKDGKGKLSAQTVKHVHRVLHVALATAVRWRILGTNPLDGVQAPSVQRAEMRTFTVEQAQSFLAASAGEGLAWESFFTVWLNTGLRSGEMLGLRWQDLDFESREIRIQQVIQRVNGLGLVVKGPKTAGSRRPVAVDADTMSLLKRHRATQREQRLRAGPLWHDHDLVFPSDVGTPLSEKTVRRIFVRICNQAEVPTIRLYDLRHSCASLLLAKGVHPKVVAERLGHSTVTLTLTTYSHVVPSLQHDAAEALGRLLRGG